MLNTVRHTIKQYNMLTRGDGVVVGLSGGVDSVVLLTVLIALRAELELSVFAVHVNHNLRSAARHDEEFVRLLCEERDIPLFVCKADVKDFAKAQKKSIEEAGRKLRYNFLQQGLEKFGAHKIATGHHAGDNAETVLLNLFRGAGLTGLCGMPPVNGQVIRPLLEVRREDIEAYAKENGLHFVTDATNAESDYSRNYVRNKIIPVITEHFGDSVTATIARNALGMRPEDALLSSSATEALRKITSSNVLQVCESMSPAFDTSKILLQIDGLLALPPALTGRVIRQAIAILRGEQALSDIQSTHIQSILEIAQGRSGREVSLPGFIAGREYANIVMQLSDKKPDTGFCYPLTPGTPVYVHLKSITLTMKSPQKKPFYCTHSFNYDKVDNVLELRTRRPGDKIVLEGVGTKKLQDYFTDTKTPKSERDRIPLLADGSNVLWIMDEHNRTSAAYSPENGQTTCWVTVEVETDTPGRGTQA